MTIAMGAFHTVRSRARERLGLSCGIRGNGWCVTHALLKQVPYRAYSLTEDIEYGIDLGVQGYRVHYTENAKVFGEMVSSASRAGSQRQRWEQGRFQLIRERTLPLLRLAIARPSRVCLDLALDLMVLPLSYVVLNVIGLGLYSGLGALIDARLLLGLWLAMACLLCLILYFLRGWSLSGTGLRGLGALLCAPAFIVWKLIVVVTGRRTTQWTRTEREQP
jgi:cellulose synthase/poly-beta-1,6-N-acetylglucosamine synthase-like glycosyltransferase